MRRIRYSLGYQILREGRILRHNPQARVPEGIAVLNEPHEANRRIDSLEWSSVSANASYVTHGTAAAL
jgi:hypothetical protein